MHEGRKEEGGWGGKLLVKGATVLSEGSRRIGFRCASTKMVRVAPTRLDATSLSSVLRLRLLVQRARWLPRPSRQHGQTMAVVDGKLYGFSLFVRAMFRSLRAHTHNTNHPNPLTSRRTQALSMTRPPTVRHHIPHHLPSHLNDTSTLSFNSIAIY